MVCKTLKEFEERWENICKKVEEKSLDRNQASTIAKDFLNEIEIFNIERKEEGEGHDIIHAMQEISNSLNVSLQIAISNYERFAKPSWFQRIFGKPEFNLDFNAVKNKIG